MVVVTHNIGVVEKMADQVLVLKNGEGERIWKNSSGPDSSDRILIQKSLCVRYFA